MLFTSQYLRNFGRYCNVLTRFTLNACKSIAIIHYKNLILTRTEVEKPYEKEKKKISTLEDGEGHHHHFRFFLCVSELGVAGDMFF